MQKELSYSAFINKNGKIIFPLLFLILLSLTAIPITYINSTRWSNGSFYYSQLALTFDFILWLIALATKQDMYAITYKIYGHERVFTVIPTPEYYFVNILSCIILLAFIISTIVFFIFYYKKKRIIRPILLILPFILLLYQSFICGIWKSMPFLGLYILILILILIIMYLVSFRRTLKT